MILSSIKFFSNSTSVINSFNFDLSKDFPIVEKPPLVLK